MKEANPADMPQQRRTIACGHCHGRHSGVPGVRACAARERERSGRAQWAAAQQGGA